MSFIGMAPLMNPPPGDTLFEDDPSDVVVPADFDPSAFPPEGGINSIWCNFLRKEHNAEHKRVSHCYHCGCGKVFMGWNATKMLAHVTRERGMNIRPCEGNIPRPWQIAYRDYRASRDRASEAKNKRQCRTPTTKDCYDCSSKTPCPVEIETCTVPTCRMLVCQLRTAS